MKLFTTTIALICCVLLLPQAHAQKQKASSRKATVQQEANPNVSGQPDVLTAPVMDQSSTAPQQPQQINMNIKRQRKVRVVPAPPPPGPISPSIPPKESR